MVKQEIYPGSLELNEEQSSLTEVVNENQHVAGGNSEEAGSPQESVIEQEAGGESTEEAISDLNENVENETVVQSSTPEALTMETVMAMFDEINNKFDEKIATDSHKNILFDKMYAELDSYKNDIYQKIMKPIVMDIIILIDDTKKILRDAVTSDTNNILKAFSMIPDDLLEILERNGIESFHDESELFNPKTQRVLKTIPTDKPEWDNKVESRIRHGYKWDNKVIKPEIIQCYKYSQTN